jgi:hypothetical protein
MSMREPAREASRAMPSATLCNSKWSARVLPVGHRADEYNSSKRESLLGICNFGIVAGGEALGGGRGWDTSGVGADGTR